jgi:hypothetical protein
MLFSRTVAFMGVQNLSKNVEYDYLAAFTEGVILYDLSQVKEITLVERTRLEKIVAEQQLILSGLLSEDKNRSMKMGKLLAAKFLVSVDYTILGGEAAFTLRLADTESGSVRVFTSRGKMENDIHKLAEALVSKLAGKNYTFINKAEKRSLITLRDMVPGSIDLYCNLQNAEILLNDKFIGYSKGTMYKAIPITDIDPGTYRLRIHLTKNFGMVKLPEFTFSDWEKEVTVRPGRKTVLRAIVPHFNHVIYKHSKLMKEEYKLTDSKSSLSDNKDIIFTDRQGNKVSIKVTVAAKRFKEKAEASVAVIYNGKKRMYKVDRKNKKQEGEIGKVKIKLGVRPYKRYDNVSVDVYRIDIHQGMHRR